MNIVDKKRSQLWLEDLVELLEIPPSYYTRAVKRYESLGEWLERQGSTLRGYNPKIYAQGSFRYGTAIRPLLESEDYDLDLVCELLLLGKDRVSQGGLSRAVGSEVVAYAKANGIQKPVKDGKRCWTLEYSDDDLKFHMDVLPAIPESDRVKSLLIARGVPLGLANLAIAITDSRESNYELITEDWPSSNPNGFAEWFKEVMKPVALPRITKLVENEVYASVDDVPTFEWKTPLQRAIQILKRHRDVMYQTNPELKPISMIITSLAGRAYRGEVDLHDALHGIIERMPDSIYPRTDGKARVPNPVNPEEDFANKWEEDPDLEREFSKWHQKVRIDLESLGKGAFGGDHQKWLHRNFGVVVGASRLPEIEGLLGATAVSNGTPRRVEISGKDHRPWRIGG